jgi:hypothetical protein
MGLRVHMAFESADGMWVPLGETFPRLWPGDGIFDWPPPNGIVLSSAALRACSQTLP